MCIRDRANTTRVMADKMIDGIEANEERCAFLAGASPSIVTPLNKVIGYEAAAKVAKKALAEIHNLVREGNKAKDPAPIAAQVRAMAAVLGVDPGAWPTASTGNSNALDVLVRAELERRATARAEKDWATADEVRDRLAAAGIEVTDTADGPQWQVKE